MLITIAKSSHNIRLGSNAKSNFFKLTFETLPERFEYRAVSFAVVLCQLFFYGSGRRSSDRRGEQILRVNRSVYP